MPQLQKWANLVFKDKYFQGHHWMAVSDFYYREYAFPSDIVIRSWSWQEIVVFLSIIWGCN